MGELVARTRSGAGLAAVLALTQALTLATVTARPAFAAPASKAGTTGPVIDYRAGDIDGSDDPAIDPDRSQPTTEELKQRFRLTAVDPAPLQNFVAPKAPDRTRYNLAAVRTKIDRSKPGKAVISSLLVEAGFKALITESNNGLLEFVRRQKGSLRAIFIEDGLVSLSQLVRDLPPEAFEQLAPRSYMARLPILVRHGATLLIDNDVRELRLSQDAGVVLINEGSLIVTGSTIIGWSEARNAPAVFKSATEFRPYIASWSGSQTYIAQSKLAHLGYAATKATGLSLSTYTRSVPERAVWGRPTGWLIDSTVEDLWYGFYCREADDVVVRGNIFMGNAFYGIDVHDDSKRLLIADNTVSGTQGKHGIILSGRISKSWVIDNKVSQNGRSGIVLDRQSRDNVVSGNLTFNNGGSGIVVSESPKNLLLGNLASGNQGHGVRIRNSTDIRLQNTSVVANGLAGISAIALDLSSTRRDLELDPYQAKVTMTAVGGQLSGNGSGPISIDEPDRVELYDVDLRTPQRALGYRLGGALLAFQIDAISILNLKQSAVLERSPGIGKAYAESNLRSSTTQEHYP